MTYDFDTDNSWLDAQVTAEPVKAKTSKQASTRLGTKWTWGADMRERLRQVNLGKKHSAETCAKIAAASQGRVMPPSHGAKVRAIQTGHKVTAETREKLRQANLGKTISAETRAKISATQKGIKRSPDFAAKISAGKTRAMMTPVGVFASRLLFQDWLEAQGVRDAYCKIGKWLKTHPTQVYYIPKEPK